MKRVHELILNDGDAQSYNRLGFTYTAGDTHAALLHPDSQHSEQAVSISWDQLQELRGYLADISVLLEDAVGEES